MDAPRRLRPYILGLMAQCTLAAAGPPQIVRGIYCHPGPAIDNRLWPSYGVGYEIDTAERHSGKASIRCTNTNDVEAHGAWQRVAFDQKEARPFVVAGWAKLEGVTGSANYRCSVYVDLQLQNGESWPMKIAAFDPAKKGWQYAEKTYTPPSPIASARAYVFLRQSKGTAWFDDIYVGEILDGEGTRSKNMLQDPSFDGGTDNELRNEFFSKLQSLGCNAFHFYRGVSWDKLMEGGDALPPVDSKDRLVDFIRDAHGRGLKVWLTVGAPAPPIQNAQSPEFPFYACVNGRWGELYTRTVAYFTQYGFDAVGVVPDEWTYDNGRVKSRFSKHQDPDVAAFYKSLPSYCNCDVCKRLFQERYGQPYPDVTKAWSTIDPVWARWAEFRYDSTAAWMQRTVKAAKQVNPDVITDTMIGVHPICLDNRIGVGAAWDKIGADTDLDCLQTDPYIFLHNYRGDSTHYYTTETAIHLTSANWRRRSGVTLESCRLRDIYRLKDAAEVYGAALSCLAHGAREFFWWHMNYLLGRSAYVEPDAPFRRVQAVYRVMKEMEPFVVDAAPSGEILVLYSRASEDTWDRLGRRGLLPAAFGESPNAKRGFVAHKKVLYFLLRRGYPFRMTYLDDPDPAKLAAARIVVAPFPFSLKESEVSAVEQLAQRGATVVLMSELSPMDELGQLLPEPRLQRLFGELKPTRDEAGAVTARVGNGKVTFLGSDCATGLFQEMEPMKDPKGRVPLPAFDGDRAAAFEQVIRAALDRPGSVFAEQPELDVEATVIDGSRGRLLLAINWDTAKPTDVAFRPSVARGAREAVGFSIGGDAAVSKLSLPVRPDGWRIHLEPQEAVLVRLR